MSFVIFDIHHGRQEFDSTNTRRRLGACCYISAARRVCRDLTHADVCVCVGVRERTLWLVPGHKVMWLFLRRVRVGDLERKRRF
jgi:hypothetical protein